MGDIESQPFLEAIRQFSLDVGKRELPVHPPDAGALSQGGRRAEDQAHAALGRPVAADRYPARHLDLPHRAVAGAGRPREDRAVLQRADRGGDRREGQGFLDLRSADEPGREPVGRADRRSSGAAGRRCSSWRTGATCCTSLRNPEHEIASPWSANTPSIATPTNRSTKPSTTRGIANRAQIRIQRIQSEAIEQEGPERLLSGYDGLLVPGGFGERGIEGKVEAIRFARERRDSVFRHLPGHAVRGDRVRPQRGGAGRVLTRPSSTRTRRTR